ncbi:MAG: hypothetical protein F9K29_07545 [Hyphomicrobiaceae bacterium]|nr:MAG: hypothetical protein F9K29_07545 [Hyphomicrobiaceae bacterium]
MNTAHSAQNDASRGSRSLADVHRQRAQLAWILGFLASVWVVSDAGYYLLLPMLGIKASYNASPVAIAIYYGLWAAIALVAFWRVYRTWWTSYENRLSTYVLVSLAFAVLLLFPGYALPLLPPINWAEPWRPPEVVFATPWYFFPKSIEILFQQLLITAMVIALSDRQWRLWTISLASATLFGGAHVLVVLDTVPAVYVVRLMTLGAAFGLVFPYLILRVRDGLAYSYLTHWCYYALTVIMAHMFYTPNATVGAGA